MTQPSYWLYQCPSCTLDLSVVKAQGSIAGFLFFQPFCHSRKIFTDHFVTARVEFGIAFSIKFLSSSALLGSRKALEQDAMSSSVSRRKVQNTCDIWFSCIVIHTWYVFLVCKFPTFKKKKLLWNLLTHAFSGMFFKPFKKLAALVLSGLKPLGCMRLVLLNPIKHSCSFFKHYLRNYTPIDIECSLLFKVACNFVCG